ncbi:MAG: hypothetical protein EAX90_15215, partial [Candidatus Heimdallarchaeota archaeon]|nr:hypothetical protein [Candidatus Heimdallarchaeota archaeon]
IGSKTTEYYHKENIWWRHEVLHRLVLNDYSNRIEVYKNERDELEEKVIEQVSRLLEVLDDKDKNEISHISREFTMKQFSEARLREENWIKKIIDMPVNSKLPIFYRAFWKKRNKRNKMPYIQM